MTSATKEVVPVRPDTILECPACGIRAAVDSGLFKLNPGQATIQTVRMCRRCGNGHPRLRPGREKVDYISPESCPTERAMLRRRMPRPAGYLRSLSWQEFPERVAKLRRLISYRDKKIAVPDLHPKIVDAAHDLIDMVRFMRGWTTWEHLEKPGAMSYGRTGEGAMSVATARRVLAIAERRLQRMRREPA